MPVLRGGEADFSLGKTGEGEDWHYLECAECEAMGPRVQYAAHNIAIKDALSSAWNTRADLHDETKAQLRKAVGALRNIAVVGFSSDPSVNGAIAKQTVLQARTVLAEIEKGGV